MTWSYRAFDTETWVLATNSAIFIVFSSREGKNFLSNCPLLHPTAIYYNHDKWQISFSFLYKLQKEMQSSTFTNRPGNSLKAKTQPHREIPSQNARGTVTNEEERGRSTGEHLPLVMFSEIIFVSRIQWVTENPIVMD